MKSDMIDEILNSLQDGKFHNIDEIMAYVRSNCSTPIPSERKVCAILRFYEEYGFIEVERSGDINLSSDLWKFKLSDKMMMFLQTIKRLEWKNNGLLALSKSQMQKAIL